ncbi:hypothetical protein AVDCRST_MAG84-4339 [uncultured Microcoleus sp.]|uniref:Uncharacterized protein n=1 Tax=uncultured Microcoleus sp. TaxID=259945 RepID=A0A6J4N2G6_9CYAN|nr:hypothetical protein AVDCRST_MAG84-4339 [uncultured Microcoleus sp.]
MQFKGGLAYRLFLPVLSAWARCFSQRWPCRSSCQKDRSAFRVTTLGNLWAILEKIKLYI